uniref:Peptidase C1A papain C-terminal domain-containing protein n=1 Tax=Entamoeba invadens TaxID=33085 RepID=S0B153_ENTIV|nr:hypothetical protein, conserved [Entamoeba invadens]
MGNKFIEQMSRFPVTQRVSVVVLFLALLVQIATVMYFRFSPVLKTSDSYSSFEEAVGNVTDIPATYVEAHTEPEFPKYARVAHNEPRYYQMERGTCWDFALIGFLQSNYRQNGIEKGLMSEDQYTLLSTQAMGIKMVDHCVEHPDVCNTPGDSLLSNSTSGGEINWFYSFPGLYKETVPDSVCPYLPTDSEEWICDNLESAIKSNPVRFDVTKMNVATTVEDVKKLFVQKGNRALAWTSLIHDDVEYFPCTQYPDLCNVGVYDVVACPPEIASGDCAKLVLPMYTPDGEFDKHGEMTMAGGHGMVMEAFTDEFVTKAGHKGGFVLKNSWNDTAYGDRPMGSARGIRGSHSIEYYLGQISYEEEMTLCPNPQDPLNWEVCTEACGKSTEISKKIMEFEHKPFEYQCVDEHVCTKDPVYRYFLRELKPASRKPSGRYFDFTMIKYNTLDDTFVDLTWKALPTQVIGLYFTPIESQLKDLVANKEYCGYYFFPYDIVEQQISYYGGFNCIYYDINWEESSYLSKKDNHKEFDYTYLDKSTTKQHLDTATFYASNPYINKRYSD